VAQIQSARKTPCEHVEKLSHGERSHDVVENVHERPTRSRFIEQALHFGL
jgi:hypothetical protein